jgi:hypothetical protein
MKMLEPCSQPHRNILLLQKSFHFTDGVGAEVENAHGEDGVGFALISLKVSRWA